MPDRLPTLFVCHGAGPSFFVDWPFGDPKGWQKMRHATADLFAGWTARPEKVLMVSAHHTEACATVTTSSAPAQLDLEALRRFPVPVPDLSFEQKGDPELASRVIALLGEAGIDASGDADRGLDHGAWIPMKLADPTADLPIVSLSLVEGLDPELHLRIGEALAPLREEGVLIAGSGATFHNMDLIRRTETLDEVDRVALVEQANTFDTWIDDVIAWTKDARRTALIDWKNAPGANIAHDTGEHLLPLMVAAGAAGGDPGHVVFRDAPWAGIKQSLIRFGVA